jgi:hypothetical protein
MREESDRSGWGHDLLVSKGGIPAVEHTLSDLKLRGRDQGSYFSKSCFAYLKHTV